MAAQPNTADLYLSYLDVLDEEDQALGGREREELQQLRAAYSEARRNRNKTYQLTEDQAARDADQSLRIGPLNEVLRAEDRTRVRVVLSRMRTSQAQILLLRADGASYKELADALKVSVGSVGTLLGRAEEEFRKRYSKLNEGGKTNERRA